MSDKRFEGIMWNSKIKDHLTGEEYVEEDFYNGNILDLLNDLNDRADKNAEQVAEIQKVMNKYGIKDADKLDKILFESGVL